MSFCRFSSKYVIDDKTSVDNLFISDFLPDAPDICVKVYLMGLAKCYCANAKDNNIINFANILNVSTGDIESAFLYWQDKGLVQLISTQPLEVVYLPISTSNLGNIKKYSIGKYADFNVKIQDLIQNRMITQTEYQEYYALMESLHITKDALLRIAQYCSEIKSENVGYSYIIAVAKNWAYEGITTLEAVEEKIQSLGLLNDKLTLVFKALGKRNKVQTIEDKEFLDKWLDGFGFDLGVVIYVAKMLKLKKDKVDLFYLDIILTKYYENKLMSISEIENFEQQKQTMYEIAKMVVKNLGLFYDDLTKTVETYILPYVQMGYDREVLEKIADYCYRNSIRTLEGMNEIVQKLFKLGVITMNSFDEYISKAVEHDSAIISILNDLGIKRKVNSFDRNYFKIWTKDWNFDSEIIVYGCSLSCDKQNPIQYLNKILGTWHSQGIKTIDQAKDFAPKFEKEIQQTPKKKRKYTREELMNVFANVDELEV